MLLRNDQYVLLCNVTGHVAQPFDPFQEPQGQYSWDGPLPQAGRVGAALLLQLESAQGPMASSEG